LQQAHGNNDDRPSDSLSLAACQLQLQTASADPVRFQASQMKDGQLETAILTQELAAATPERDEALAKEDAMAVHKQNGAAFPVTECEVADLKLQLKKLEEVCSCLHA